MNSAHPRNRMFRIRERQDALLAFVTAFIRAHQVPPTYRQIAAGTGVGLSAVGRHIAQLIERGALIRSKDMGGVIALPDRCTRIQIQLHPEVAGELVLFATAHGISVETAAAEAIRAYVGAAA